MDVIGIANSATVTSGGTTAPSAGTVQTFTVTTAANFPVLTTGQRMLVMDTVDAGHTSGYEVMGVTANANGTGVSWTVTRGVFGTPHTHTAGWTLVPVLAPGGLDGRYGTPLKFTIPYNASGLNTGFDLGYTMAVGQVIENYWVSPTTAFDGLTPQLDLGVDFGSQPLGFAGQVGASPISVSTATAALPSNPGILLGIPGSSWVSSLVSLSETLGPPMGRPEMHVSTAQNLMVVVSQDGTANTPVAAALTAQTAVTLPLTLTSSNNNFNFYGAPKGSRAIELFTIATGTYTALTSGFGGGLEPAIAAATGSLSSEPFSNYCTVSDNGAGKLVFTANGSTVKIGAASNGNLIVAGNHDATTPLGFTGANVFGTGTGNTVGLGGDPGATTGSITLFVKMSNPVVP